MNPYKLLVLIGTCCVFCLPAAALARGRASVTVGEAEILGPIEPELFSRVASSHLDALSECVGEEEEGGELLIELVVHASGAVARATVRASGEEGALDDCVTRQIESWHFGKTRAAGVILISFPLLFAVGEEEASPRADGEAVVTVGRVVVEGVRDRPLVQRLVSLRSPALGVCYVEARARGVEWIGALDVTFMISNYGKVPMARVMTEGMEQTFEHCVEREIKRWTFTETDGGVDRVRVPISFAWKRAAREPEEVVGERSVGDTPEDAGESIPKIKMPPRTIGPLIDKDVIRRVMTRNSAGAKHCYQRELAKNPDLGGLVKMSFTIDEKGRATQVKVASSTVGNEVMEACLVEHVSRLRFPEPKGGGVVRITYPYHFGAK